LLGVQDQDDGYHTESDSKDKDAHHHSGTYVVGMSGDPFRRVTRAY
jgi:hypothetical protein